MVLYSQAVDDIPLSMLRLTSGTPGRIGYTLAQQMHIVTYDTIKPGQLLESQALTVIALVEKARRNDMVELQAAIEYQWTILRCAILVQCILSKQHHWMKLLARRQSTMDLIVKALRVGEPYDNGHYHHDTWEGIATTEQIIEWFETLCKAD